MLLMTVITFTVILSPVWAGEVHFTEEEKII